MVLNNWHRLDPSGPIRAENLACNSRFLGGLDETWFYTATVEIEARGGGVFGALLEVGLTPDCGFDARFDRSSQGCIQEKFLTPHSQLFLGPSKYREGGVDFFISEPSGGYHRGVLAITKFYLVYNIVAVLYYIQHKKWCILNPT